MTWPEVLLGDVIEVFDSKRIPLSRRERAQRQGAFPYYGAQGVIDHVDDYLFEGRYILIPEDGENLNSRKLPIAYFADGRFWVNNHAHVIRARPGVAIDRFVQSALQATDISPFITGAAQPKLSQANLRRIPMRLPSLREQQRISDVLDAIDDLIDSAARRVVLLEGIAQAIYTDWFEHFRYPGHEGDELVDSPLGPIPSGWKVASLSEFCELHRESLNPHAHPDELFSHFSIPAFDDTRLPVREAGNQIRSNKYLLAQPSVLVSKLNPRISRVWFAQPTPGSRSIGSTEFLVLTPRGPWSLAFLYLTATSSLLGDHLVALSAGTSTSHQRARPQDVLALMLLNPPERVLRIVDEVASPTLQLVEVLRRQGQVLRSIRDLVLPRLVSGQIDVSALDLDELIGEAAA